MNDFNINCSWITTILSDFSVFLFLHCSETNQTNELKTKKKRKEFELTLNAISATSATDITHIQDKGVHIHSKFSFNICKLTISAILAQTSAQDIIKDAQNVDGEQKTAATDSTEAKKDAQDSSTLLQICLHAEISPEHMSPQQISPALPLVVAISNKVCIVNHQALDMAEHLL